MKVRKKTSTAGKIAVTVTAAVLLLVLYTVIFGFSAQDGEESGSLSLRISEGCVAFLNSLTGGRFSKQLMGDLALYFEHPVRKLAHFSEYAVMGCLVWLVFCPWLKRGKGLYILVVLWVFVSGAFDEFHQLFVPGRYGSFADVLLDTCGGTFGLLVCVFLSRVRKRE